MNSIIDKCDEKLKECKDELKSLNEELKEIKEELTKSPTSETFMSACMENAILKTEKAKMKADYEELIEEVKEEQKSFKEECNSVEKMFKEIKELEEYKTDSVIQYLFEGIMGVWAKNLVLKAENIKLKAEMAYLKMDAYYEEQFQKLIRQ